VKKEKYKKNKKVFINYSPKKKNYI